MNRERFLRDVCQMSGGKPMIAQAENGYCALWDQQCTIHPVKPRMCRRWPFIESILVDAGNWHAMAATCPGMRVDVVPNSISLAPGQSASFDVTVTYESGPLDLWRFGSMTWRSDDHDAQHLGLDGGLQGGQGLARAHAIKAPGDLAVGEEFGVGDLVGEKLHVYVPTVAARRL